MTENLKRRRVEGTTVSIPIIIGSCAHFLGKKSGTATDTSASISNPTDNKQQQQQISSQATHKWTFYIRGPNGEDLSLIISKVAFILHPSFEVPIKEISSPPFEVSEYGWGEFDAGVRIFWHDPDEQPVDLKHFLKLYHTDTASSTVNTKKTVVSEAYDEIIFTDPTNEFKRLLMLYRPPPYKETNQLSEHFLTFDDTNDLQKMTEAHDHITKQLDMAKSKVFSLDAEIASIIAKNVVQN